MNPPHHPAPLLVPLVLSAALGAACATGARDLEVEPGPSRPAAAGHVPADVDFVLYMIHHHAQAIEMVGLIEERTDTEAIARAGHRIELSQEAEIARMRRWLDKRDEPAPEAHAHGVHMPGMLTAEEMASLAAASGAVFDRRFLELMIRHHEGALLMVRELLSHEGAGQEPELFILVSHIEADQRAEIARMRGMLSTYPQGGSK